MDLCEGLQDVSFCGEDNGDSQDVVRIVVKQ